MRTIRALTTALALVAVLPGIGAAQTGRPFKDSWFWGVKGGGVTYASPAGGTGTAPAVGADWLITRTNGGLYVAFSQSFLTERAFIDTLDANDVSAPHQVDLKDLRRVEIAAMAFPQLSARWHPYAGLGVAISQIGTATANSSGLDANERDILASTVTNFRTGVSPLVMLGTQYRLPMVSVFGQVSFAPTGKNFFLYNGNGAQLGYEFGVRYNIGSSIAPDK